jgi:hypothetical protein
VILARGRALAGTLALMAASGIWILSEAAPAAAYVCAFGIESPAPGSVVGAPSVRLVGPFATRQGLAERILDVTFTQSPGARPAPTVRTGASVGPAGRFDVTVGSLSLNGEYTARVKSSHLGTSPLFNCDDGIGPERRDTEATAEVTFGVSVRANPPANVKARFDAGPRTAVVTWERSGDPDIAGYTITRRVGSGGPTAVDVPAAPLSWTDTQLPAGAATITYSVQAARNGPQRGTTSERSAPVAAAPLDVPAPPSPTTAATAGTGGTGGTGGAGASTPTTAPFVLGRSVGATSPSEPSPMVPLPGGLAPPLDGSNGDGTYRPLLPYPPPDQDPAPSGDGGGDQAIVGRASDGVGGDGPPQLAFIASGLLSTVVAAHVLWLRRQALRPEPATPPGPSGHAAEAPVLEPVETVEPVSTPEPAPPPPPPDPEADAAFAPVVLVEPLLRDRTRRRGAPDAQADDDAPPGPAPVLVVPSAPSRSIAASVDGPPGPTPSRPPDVPLRDEIAVPAAAAAGRRPLRVPARPATRLITEDRPGEAEPIQQAEPDPRAAAVARSRRRPLRSPNRPVGRVPLPRPSLGPAEGAAPVDDRTSPGPAEAGARPISPAAADRPARAGAAPVTGERRRDQTSRRPADEGAAPVPPVTLDEPPPRRREPAARVPAEAAPTPSSPGPEGESGPPVLPVEADGRSLRLADHGAAPVGPRRPRHRRPRRGGREITAAPSVEAADRLAPVEHDAPARRLGPPDLAGPDAVPEVIEESPPPVLVLVAGPRQEGPDPDRRSRLAPRRGRDDMGAHGGTDAAVHGTAGARAPRPTSIWTAEADNEAPTAAAFQEPLPPNPAGKPVLIINLGSLGASSRERTDRQEGPP